MPPLPCDCLVPLAKEAQPLSLLLKFGVTLCLALATIMIANVMQAESSERYLHISAHSCPEHAQAGLLHEERRSWTGANLPQLCNLRHN